MKKDKIKEIGRFVILWAIGLSIALLASCTPPCTLQYSHTECERGGFNCVDIYDEICYY